MSNQNKDNQFRYDAFISYRHCEPDQFVAEELHKALEAFKLPSNIVKKLKKDNPDTKTKISRVFRDQEELPLASNLADPIIEAIENTEWLIVICSPRLGESMWCKKEIETFISLRGREHVLAVLVEGEPNESFPEILTYREVEITKPDGTKETVREAVEPLALDVRADNNKDRAKMIKNDLPRLTAPMFGVSFDDLKQRHRERMLRRMLAIASIIAVVSIAFAIVSIISTVTISKQRDEIQAKSDEISAQSLEIVSQNEALRVKQAENLAEDSLELLARDDRRGAIEKAYEALTESDGETMPYTDRAFYALNCSMSPYNITDVKQGLYQIKTRGVIDGLKISPDSSTLLIWDTSNTVTMWDVSKSKPIDTFVNVEKHQFEDLFIFSGDKYLFYLDDSDLYRYDIANTESVLFLVNREKLASEDIVDYEKEEEIMATGFSVNSILVVNDEINTCYIASGKHVAAYDINTLQKKYDTDLTEYFQSSVDYVDKLIAVPGGGFVTLNSNIGLLSDGVATICVFDINGRFKYTLQRDSSDTIINVLCDDDYMIILSRDYGDVANIKETSNITAYALPDGHEVWSHTDMNKYTEELYFLQEDEGKNVIEIGGNVLEEYKLDNGEKTFSYSETSTILWSEGYEDVVYYITDEPILMMLQDHSNFGSKINLQCHLSGVKYAVPAQGGYFFAEKNSNRVVYYNEFENIEFDDYKGKVKDAVSELFLLQDASDREAIEDKVIKSLPDQEFLKGAVYDDDKETLCVTCKDDTVRLYRVDDMEVIAQWEIKNNTFRDGVINTYVGEDKDGNTYWASDSAGYVLSPNNNLIGELDYLRAVDKKNNLLIFGVLSSEERFSTKILSVDEIIKMAKDSIK